MDAPVIDIDHEDLESEETFEESVFAPFGRFFDDDLFMLIYTNPGVLPANLRVLRNKLQVVDLSGNFLPVRTRDSGLGC